MGHRRLRLQPAGCSLTCQHSHRWAILGPARGRGCCPHQVQSLSPTPLVAPCGHLRGRCSPRHPLGSSPPSLPSAPGTQGPTHPCGALAPRGLGPGVALVAHPLALEGVASLPPSLPPSLPRALTPHGAGPRPGPPQLGLAHPSWLLRSQRPPVPQWLQLPGPPLPPPHPYPSLPRLWKDPLQGGRPLYLYPPLTRPHALPSCRGPHGCSLGGDASVAVVLVEPGLWRVPASAPYVPFVPSSHEGQRNGNYMGCTLNAGSGRLTGGQ
jgi:hypothetical protein